MWAMIRMFIAMMKNKKEGKYVLMRDPNKAIIRLFSVPADTFEDEE
jgi:translation initiation factor 3 subunit D